MTEQIDLDVLVLGGGVTGLWTLDRLRNNGYSAALVERTSLGDGQTIHSQGIIHGGLKYLFSGKVQLDLANEVAQAPYVWKNHLDGHALPDLSRVPVSSCGCYYFTSKQESALSGFFDWIAINAVLRTGVSHLDEREVPALLAKGAREVYESKEEVIETTGLLRELARPHHGALFYASDDGIHISGDSKKTIWFTDRLEDKTYAITPLITVLAAGVGNRELARTFGFDEAIMQARPLRHATVVSDKLPSFYGHCIDGCVRTGKPAFTITTHPGRNKKTAWNIGGGLGDLYLHDPQRLIDETKRQLSRVFRDTDFSDAEWGTFYLERAEPNYQGERPRGIGIVSANNTHVVFPTKLVLAPTVANVVLERVQKTLGLRKPSEAGDFIEPSGESSVAIPTWNK